MNKILINNSEFELLIDKDKIFSKVEAIASSINDDYHGKEPIFLVTLRGALFFSADLLRLLKLDCQVDFLKADSYGNSTESSGTVEFIMPKTRLDGKDIIVLEDIVDSGLTIYKLKQELEIFSPNSIEIASIIIKSDNIQYPLNIKYKGFSIGKEFVVGYGMDYCQLGRNYPDIYRMI